MLTALEFENFKGIGQSVRIELRPITLLFGPNSAGKSTILHALHYAHEILSRRNLNPDRTDHGGDSVDLGGFQTFVHKKHAADRGGTIRFRFELDLRTQDLPELPPPRLEQIAPESATEPEELVPLDFYNDGLDDQIEFAVLEITVEWSVDRNAPILRAYSVAVNGEAFARIEASPDGAQVDLFPEFAHELFAHDGRLPEDEQREQRTNQKESWSADGSSTLAEYYRGARVGVRGLARSALPRWGELLDLAFEGEDLEFFAFPLREFRYRVSTVLVGIGQLLRDELASLRYLGPMRDVLPRVFAPPRRPELGRWASGFAAWDLLYSRGDTFTREVSDWLRRVDCLGTGYGLDFRSLKELRDDSPLMISIRRGTLLDDVEDLSDEIAELPERTELRLIDAETGTDVHPSDVGVGISQVLPVVVAVLDSDRPTLTAIEQPELHIHPRVQVRLGDLFAKEVSEGRVFLLETHSEHLILRLLRRISETSRGELNGAPALGPDDVSVVYVQRLDGEVKLTRLRIDPTGEFVDRWPDGFFDEREDELF